MMRVRATISVLAACLALAACSDSGPILTSDDPSPPAASTPSEDPQPDPTVYFQTSDENISCGISADEEGNKPEAGEASAVACFINKTDYDVLNTCDARDSPKPYGIMLPRSGAPEEYFCNGAPQAVWGWNSGVAEPASVEYGPVDLGAASCVVSRGAVSCLSRDGHGFYLSEKSHHFE